jgi:hypothetical protein
MLKVLSTSQSKNHSNIRRFLNVYNDKQLLSQNFAVLRAIISHLTIKKYL